MASWLGYVPEEVLALSEAETLRPFRVAYNPRWSRQSGGLEVGSPRSGLPPELHYRNIGQAVFAPGTAGVIRRRHLPGWTRHRRPYLIRFQQHAK